MQKTQNQKALRVLLFDAAIVALFIFYLNIVILFRIFHFLILLHLLIAAGNNAAFATDTARITQFHRFSLCVFVHNDVFNLSFLFVHFELICLLNMLNSSKQNYGNTPSGMAIFMNDLTAYRHE